MSFEVSADSYARFMGRFSEPLAAEFVQAAQVRPGQRGLDVGCGPGVLTARLVALLGVDAVAAVEPSAPFVAATRARLPGLDVRVATAEALPFPAHTFDVTLAQLVVHFMTDPVGGLREMGRVTRPGGTVGACVWDQATGGGPLATFWAGVHDLDPDATDESDLPGAREGHLAELAAAAGLRRVELSTLTVTRSFETFTEWWHPFTLGVGPAGAYVTGLDEAGRESLRRRCAERLPTGRFSIDAAAWCMFARAP